MRHTIGIVVLASAVVVSPAMADTITLTNGRVIEADRTWVQGTQLLYEKNGGTFGLPRSLVEKVEQRAAPETAADPDIRRAREQLARGDPAEAVRLLQAALARDPSSLAALHALAEVYLSLGDARSARDATDKAMRLDDRNAATRALRGDALVGLGDRAAAAIEYQKSLQLRADADVQRKLREITPSALPASPAPRAKGALFRVRYDGSVNEPLGMAVLQSLTGAYNEYTRRLGGSPEEPITVVLQTEARFQDARPPLWADGINDGTIRIPVLGLESPTPRLVRVLRHELAHSFVAARTAGNCPTWLHEGIAQWLEGGDPARDDPIVAAAAREGRLLPLLTLEAPFQSLSETDAALAYAESLSAVAHILRRSGEAGVVRLLSALGDRIPSEEALPVAIALSYRELQATWSEALRAVKANGS